MTIALLRTTCITYHSPYIPSFRLFDKSMSKRCSPVRHLDAHSAPRWPPHGFIHPDMPCSTAFLPRSSSSLVTVLTRTSRLETAITLPCRGICTKCDYMPRDYTSKADAKKEMRHTLKPNLCMHVRSLPIKNYSRT